MNRLVMEVIRRIMLVKTKTSIMMLVTVISSNRSSGSSGMDRTGGTIKIDDYDYNSHVVTTYDGSSFDS